MVKKFYPLLLLFAFGMFMTSCKDHLNIGGTSSATISSIDTTTCVWTSYHITNNDTICTYVLDNTRVKAGETLHLDATASGKASNLQTILSINYEDPIRIESYPYHLDYVIREAGKFRIKLATSYHYDTAEVSGSSEYSFTIFE